MVSVKDSEYGVREIPCQTATSWAALRVAIGKLLIALVSYQDADASHAMRNLNASKFRSVSVVWFGEFKHQLTIQLVALSAP